MAKSILTSLDLQSLTALDTPRNGSINFAAKSDGLYQKIGTVESKLSTTAELLDRVKTAVPLNAKFTDTNTTYGVATTSANGLMSSTDKSKLNGIATGANNYSLPTASGTVLGGIKVGSRLSIASGVLSATQQTANDFTTVLKNKLDGIATGANNYVHPTGAGNNHIPTGGAEGQFLKWDSSGVAVWAADNNTTYSAGTGLNLIGNLFGQSITFSGSGSFVTSITQTANGFQVNLGTPPNTNTTYSEITEAEINAGTSSTLRTITGRRMMFALNKKANASHAHSFADVPGLQSALEGKVNNSQVLTDVPAGAKFTDTTYGAVTTSANGLMIAADKVKLNGIATGANNYTLPVATATVRGGVELFSNTVQSVAANAVTTTASRTYGIQLNSAGQAVVNVPWSNTNTTYSAGTGLSLSGTTFGQAITTSGSGSFVTGITQTTSGFQVNLGTPPNTTYSAGTLALLQAGTNTSNRVWSAKILNDFTDGKYLQLSGGTLIGDLTAPTFIGALSGNATSATTATKLGTTTVGSSQLPFYLNAGTATAITQANLRRGLFGTTAIGSTTRPIYIAANGVPTAITGSIANSTTGSAATLTTARTIALSGGATGTATSFNGSSNITIPVTALNANQLTTGTVPDARLTGIYTGFSHKINGTNTLFTSPSSGSDARGRTVFGLAEYRAHSSTATGAIIFIAPFTKASTIMKSIEIDGMIYSASNIVRIIINNYTSGLTKKMSYGTQDIAVRVGETADGNFCVILGDVATTWYYPHFTLSKAMFSHSSVADTSCYGWTTALVTSLTGYVNISAEIANSPIVTNITGNATSATNVSRSVVAGNGLTGGGALTANRTLTLGTPSNITLSSTNSVAASSHTHSLALGGTASQYLNGATALVTIPTITAGNGLSGGGQLTATRTLTLGTPSTLTNATTNSVAATSHTHSITTTTVGAANTIVATDASGGVRGNVIRIGANWTLELSGTELVFKYSGVIKQRMLADGTILATGGVTALATT